MVTAEQRPLSRDLLGAVGWAVFIGIGFALGLAAGSLGADVPTDSGFLTYIGLIVGIGTLVVRLGMVVVNRNRRGGTPAGQGRAYRPRPERSRIAGAAPYRPRPVERPSQTGAADTRTPSSRSNPAAPKASPSASKGSPTRKAGAGKSAGTPRAGATGSSKASAAPKASPAKPKAASKTAPKPATKKPPAGGAKNR